METRVGIGVIVREGDRLLVGERRGSHGASTWGLPGGHLEPGETVEACARRETEEETGLHLDEIEQVGFSESFFDADERHYVTLFVEARAVTGELVRREPTKCAGWRWVLWHELPEPLFAPLAAFLARDARALAPAHRVGGRGQDIDRHRDIPNDDDGAVTRTNETTRDIGEIRHLEEGLWRSGTRGDSAWLDACLHDDFVEIGRSGRRYARADFFPVEIEPFEATVPLLRFTAREIARGCVLTTYDSELVRPDGVELAHRSSMWVDVDGCWRLRYHQGTPFERSGALSDE